MLLSPEDMLRTVRNLPEKKLRLIDLAWEVAKGDGSLDQSKNFLLIDEIEAARQEASAYAYQTKKAVWALKDLARYSS